MMAAMTARIEPARHYFGTDGVRGVAGTPPMTAAFAFRLGSAAAEALRRRGGTAPRVAVGMDTRRSGPMLAHAITAGLTSRGAHVTWLGVMPTPGVSYLTRQLGCDAGVVVSASHNPYRDNGIKFFDAEGRKLLDEVEAEIEALLDAEVPPVTGEEIGSSGRYRHDDATYESFLLSHAPYLDGLKVGLDCANGAASAIAPRVFRKIGARLDVLFAEPDGVNINVDCGSTHPEALRARVLEHRLDLGVAFDGDADRAILVDRRGRLVTGDHVLAICALARGAKEVVATVMTNLGTERWLAERGVALHRVQVGDRYVHEELTRRGLELGGEQSGHVLFLDKAPTGDGILTALQLLAALRTSRKPLDAWMDEIPTFPQTLVNVRVPVDRKRELAGHPEVAEALRRAEEALGADGRINLRPSGTEPLVRVMVEGADEGAIHGIARDVASTVERVAAG